MHYQSLTAALEQYSGSLTHYPASPNSLALHIDRQTQGRLKLHTPDTASKPPPNTNHKSRRPVAIRKNRPTNQPQSPSLKRRQPTHRPSFRYPPLPAAHHPCRRRHRLPNLAAQVEVDADNEAVFEFGIGEAVPLSEQDGFEHGQQGIGGTAAVVSKVTGSLTIQVLFDRLPINHLVQLQ